MEDQSQLFELVEDSWLDVYATGETDINLVSVDSVYHYKPDAMDIFFRSPISGANSSYTFPLKDSVRGVDSVSYLIDEIVCDAFYDKQLRQYRVKITIPFCRLGITDPTLQSLDFNIAAADNDDKIMQKAKLVWVGKVDPRYQQEPTYGKIYFVNDTSTVLNREGGLRSLYQSDGLVMQAHQNALVQNLAFGQINKPEDFSMTITSTWDQEFLYIYGLIKDNKEGMIIPSSLKKTVAFHDLGWIENEKGETVWTMRNYHTIHAGGAAKNRWIHQELNLKAGRYILRYRTDESHSWGNWDDDEPDVPFYGIKVYKK